MKKPKRKPIHPRVKSGAGAASGAAALVVVANWAGFDLPLPVAEAFIVLAGFLGGYVIKAE